MGLVIFITCFMFGPKHVKASHLLGVDINYTCLGNHQYEVTVTLYRDCGGIPAPNTIDIHVTSASCGLAFVENVAQAAGSGQEISQLCPADIALSECNSNNPTYPGVELYRYTTVVTLPQECNDWKFSWHDCCRSGDITTLQNPNSEDLYVEAMTSNVGGLCNNSPSFTTQPVPYICAGELFVFNHGVIEPDGDFLHFSLINPRTWDGPDPTDASPIPHVSGLNATQPLFTDISGFGFNSSSGQMTFTPDLATGVQEAVVTMLVTEVRNGDTIGTVMRDVQIVVLGGCSNESVFSNNSAVVVNQGGSFDSTTQSFIVCSGETLVFSFGISDPDGDTITLSALNTNIDQAFGTGNATLLLDYPNAPTSYDTATLTVLVNGQGTSTNLGNNYFTIGFSDNACPVPSEPILGFNVIVPGITILASDTAICAGIQQDIQLFSQTFTSFGGNVPGNFQWKQIGGPPVAFSDDTIANPTCNIPATTTIGDLITLAAEYTTIPDPVTQALCTTGDTVYIRLVDFPLTMDMTASETNLCPNTQNTIDFTSAIYGPGIDLVNGDYTWTTNPPAAVAGISDQTISTPKATITGNIGDLATYYLKYTYGACEGEDSITVSFNKIAELNVDTYSAPGCSGNGEARITFVRNLSGDPNPGNPNSIRYNWSTGATDVLTVSGLNPGTYNVTAEDSTGCLVKNTFSIEGATIFLRNIATADASCGSPDGSIVVTPSGGTGAYTYLWSDGQTTQQATNLAGGTYSVTITDSTGCSTSGFFTISGAGVELSVADQKELICHGASDGAVDLEPNIPATTGTLSYNWSNGATTEDISGLPAGLYTVTATADVNGITCTSTQSIEIREPPQPLLPIITQTAFADCINSDDNQFNATTTGGWPSYSYLWNDGETDPYRAYITGGTYTVTVTDGQGCKEEASITISPNITPALNPGFSTGVGPLEPTIDLVDGSTILLDAGADPSQVSIPGATYTWTVNPATVITDSTSPVASAVELTAITNPTLYTFTIRAQIGICTREESITATVKAGAMHGVPNAFAPEGQNKVFRPVLDGAENVVVSRFEVYNRWGQKLFDDPNSLKIEGAGGWDGTFQGQPQPRDAYFYVFEYRLPDETEPTVLRGEFYLIR